MALVQLPPLGIAENIKGLDFEVISYTASVCEFTHCLNIEHCKDIDVIPAFRRN
ncbi:protein of unknown function [Xenorhabdus poinarii G6]|uniref:Uncharacterized protein n=1 Tax=Xenorhabdus poinarii G6 TaxID=1354304 RepID=A0A068R0T1_9GAMM|nr:protein of unknown function [Xenorhabdus poinarii G6]